MEQRSNKTIMSSVFFLDIVEYSKESVVGQISLKDRFNKFLSSALTNVPDADRIILDTGDGAAVSFIGDIEEALNAAFSLRESLLNQDLSIEPQLRVRMGINLGPVRLVRDINNQPNIVGDGINVAQRIMAFADINQILLSRSYYDAVRNVAPQYATMFRFKGSHTDKHVREHEVYAICVPGEETVQTPVVETAVVPPPVPQKEQSSNKRPVYIAAGVAGLALVAGLFFKSSPSEPPVVANNTPVNNAPISSISPVSSIPPKGSADTVANTPVASAVTASHSSPSATKTAVPSKTKTSKPVATAKASEVVATPANDGEGRITIACAEGSQVFVDGSSKGKVGSTPLSISVRSGKHLVIVNSPTGVINQQIELEAGKTVRVGTGSCN